MSGAGIAENLISDVLFVLITILLSWLALVVTGRIRLLKFFGIDANRRLVLYLSNLRITQGGAIGIDGRTRSYEGHASALGEMLAASRFRSLFNYLLPGLSDSTESILSRVLISDTRVQIMLSPLSQGELEQSAPFITLGSPAYSTASQFAENTLHSKARFRLGEGTHPTTTRLPSEPTVNPFNPSPRPSGTVFTGDFPLSTAGSPAGYPGPPISDRPSGINIPQNPTPPSSTIPRRTEELPTAIIIDDVPPITQSNYGFVERIIEHEKKRTVFYVAGISDLATTGAAYYVATEWGKLYRKYGNDTSFLVMLRIEPTDYKRWTVVFEKR